ncbi:MAG: pyridoxal-phosphate-dependent aminotransferase family protein [Hydrogenobaculum sp.]
MNCYKSTEKLFTPGPVEIPEEIRAILGAQIIHHRTPEFKKALIDTRNLFKKLISSESDNFVFFASSGTGAMEAAVINFFNPGDKVLVLNGGKFAERWLELCKTYGLDVVDFKVEWGETYDKEALKEAIEKENVKGVFIQISETSTATYHDPKFIGSLLKDKDILLVADAITALGTYEIKPEEDGIDILVGGSQKSFMLPPGLSMLWFSEKASKRLNPKGYYFNISKELKKQIDGQTAYTPAIPIILGLQKSLEMILNEGIKNIEKKTTAISKATLKAFEKMGFKAFSKNPSISVSAIETPNMDAENFRKELLKLGIRTAGGQDRLKGKIFRVSHMGQIDAISTFSVIQAASIVMGTSKDVLEEYINTVKALCVD